MASRIRIPAGMSNDLSYVAGLVEHSYASLLMLFSLWFAGVAELDRAHGRLALVFRDSYRIVLEPGEPYCEPCAQCDKSLDECLCRAGRIVSSCLSALKAYCTVRHVYCYEAEKLSERHRADGEAYGFSLHAVSLIPHGIAYYALPASMQQHLPSDEIAESLTRIGHTARIADSNVSISVDGHFLTATAEVDGIRVAFETTMPRYEHSVDDARIYSVMFFAVRLSDAVGRIAVPEPRESLRIASLLKDVLADALSRVIDMVDSTEVECVDDTHIARLAGLLLERGAITRGELCRESLRMKLELHTALLKHGTPVSTGT